MAYSFGTWTSLSPKVTLAPAVASDAVVLTAVNAVSTQGESILR